MDRSNEIENEQQSHSIFGLSRSPTGCRYSGIGTGNAGTVSENALCVLAIVGTSDGHSPT